jgi:inhibitor of cysteine peptidase
MCVVRMHSFFLARVAALAAAWLLVAPAAGSPAEVEKAPKTMVSLVETDNGRTIDVRPGETVQVTLPENATTGYRWAVDHYDQDSIEAVSTEPHYPAKAVGAGGEVAFSFRAKKIGSGEIVLKHWRQWEGDASVTDRFRVQLHVQP